MKKAQVSRERDPRPGRDGGAELLGMEGRESKRGLSKDEKQKVPATPPWALTYWSMLRHPCKQMPLREGFVDWR